MKKEDIKFICKFGMLMEHVAWYVNRLLDNIDINEIFSFLDVNELWKSLDKFEEFQDAINELVEDDNEELIEAVDVFCQALYYLNDEPDLKKEDDVITRKKKLFERESMKKATENLLLKVVDYASSKGIDHDKNIGDFTTIAEINASYILSYCSMFLAFLRDASKTELRYFEQCEQAIEDYVINLSYTDKYNETEYLVRNKDGKILKYCDDKGNDYFVSVKEKRLIDRFKDVKYSDNPRDINSALVNKKDLTDWHFGIEKKEIVKEDKKENQKTEDKKIDVKKNKVVKEKKYKKKKSFNIIKSIKGFFINVGGWFKGIGKGLKSGFRSTVDGTLNVMEDLTVGDIVLGILPVLIMVTYLILLVTGVMDQITFSFNFNGTLFGYNFELSGMFADWLESTDHGFFSAITLGLIQVILIVIGFVLDLVIHLLFLISALLWVLIIFIFSMCFYYVFPVAISVWLIVNCFRVDSDKKTLAVICMLIGVICCVLYFLIGINVI